jgi:hypothetical protein
LRDRGQRLDEVDVHVVLLIVAGIAVNAERESRLEDVVIPDAFVCGSRVDGRPKSVGDPGVFSLCDLVLSIGN